jgi:hypothetical protein
MVEEKYARKGMDEAVRLAIAIQSIPDNIRPAFTRMIEAMILGAEMADRLAISSAPQT